MLWFIKQFWRALAALATWIGLFFLAKDVYELPEALKAWSPLAPDRETVLAIFSGILVLWIVWGDVRPAVRKYFSDRGPIDVDPKIFCEALRLMEVGQDKAQEPALWENIFYLVIRNSSHRTIRNVSVHLHSIEGIERCEIKEGGFSADIRHGDPVLFRLGRVVSTEFSGLPRAPGNRVTKQEMDGYLHNVPKGFLSFEPASSALARFGSGSNETGRASWTFPVVITADDLPSKPLGISVDMTSQKIAVAIGEAVTGVRADLHGRPQLQF